MLPPEGPNFRCAWGNGRLDDCSGPALPVIMSNPALDIEHLTLAERLELIDRLWGSVVATNPPLTAEMRAELDRRLDALDRDGPRGLARDELWAWVEKKAG